MNLFCSQCGATLLVGKAFCPHCGSPSAAELAPAPTPLSAPASPSGNRGVLIGVLVALICLVGGAIVGLALSSGGGDEKGAVSAAEDYFEARTDGDCRALVDATWWGQVNLWSDDDYTASVARRESLDACGDESGGDHGYEEDLDHRVERVRTGETRTYDETDGLPRALEGGLDVDEDDLFDLVEKVAVVEVTVTYRNGSTAECDSVVVKDDGDWAFWVENCDEAEYDGNDHGGDDYGGDSEYDY